MNKFQIGGCITIIIGLVLIVIGLVVLPSLSVYDTTPPVIGWVVGTQPIDGQVCQPGVLTYVAMWAHDRESDIDSTSAYYILDGGTPIKLDLQPAQPKAYPMAMAFEKSGLTDPLPGVHTFKFQVKNGAGLTGETSGTFSIYTGLQGTWYINDIEITEMSQLHLTTSTATFKFVKTQGVHDSQITCTAEWSGTETGSIILANTASSTWTNEHTFTQGGKYAVTLTADDGTESIVTTIWNFTTGSKFEWPLEWFTPESVGVALSLVGFAVTIITRKK